MAFTLGQKFNENTDWEFTVSNETIAEMVQADGGITEQDITAYCFTALIDKRIHAMVPESVRSTNDGLYPWSHDYCAAYNTNNGAHPSKVVMNKNALDSNKASVYERNILTYDGTINDKTGRFLVMDVKNIKKWIVDYDVYPIFSSSNVSSTNGFNGYSGGVYVYSESNIARVLPYQAPENPAPTANLHLLNIVTMNNTLWVGALNPTAHSKDLLSNEHMPHQAWDTAYAAGNVFNTGYPDYILQGTTPTMQGWCNFPDFEFPDASGQTTVFNCYLECNDDVNSIIRVFGQYGNSQNQYETNCEQGNIVKSHANALTVQSWCGLLFKDDNKIYKPIIQGGVIVGYTDNMETPSEFDNMTNVTGNNISPTPPGGGGGGQDDDKSDDQSWGGAYSGAGVFSKFYLCTATDLANLRTWFGGGGSGDKIPDGFDPMGQVLGLLQYPVSIAGTALAPEEIVFRSGKTIIHTGVNADRSTGGFLHIDCGSVEIPRRMQERGVPFLDFETSLEIYVPFCGTAPLDVQTCVGKTLTCDMYVATATGDVSAVIAAGGHPVAYMSGNMAESLPISSTGYGMYLAACKSTWGNGVSQVMNQLTGGTTSTIKNVNQAALNETLSYGQTGGWGQSELLAESYNNPAIGRGMAGAASAKGVAAIGLTTTALNIANAASTGYEQYQRVKNASYTSVSGSFTSCAAWNYPFIPYVKITRPHQQIPTGGKGGYKHTSAIPLVETKTLSGAPGLTTCINPDVSGISNATAQEKDIIYRALVNGVIV